MYIITGITFTDTCVVAHRLVTAVTQKMTRGFESIHLNAFRPYKACRCLQSYQVEAVFLLCPVESLGI